MTSSGSTSHRRLFRFRLRTLLALPLLFAMGWWWVTWPERTATRFVGLLKAGDINHARMMCDESAMTNQFLKLVESGVKIDGAAIQSATTAERISAVRRFDALSSHGKLQGFVATRGRVSLDSGAGPGLFAAYQLRNIPAYSANETLIELFGGNSEFKFVADIEKNMVVTRLPQSLDSHVRAWVQILDVAPSQTSRLRVSREAVEKILQEMKLNLESKSGGD